MFSKTVESAGERETKSSIEDKQNTKSLLFLDFFQLWIIIMQLKIWLTSYTIQSRVTIQQNLSNGMIIFVKSFGLMFKVS